MTPSELAAYKVAEKFVKNTQVKEIDPAWITALVEIIIYLIKYCEQKKDLKSFKGAVQSGISPLGRYFGLGRKVRAAIKKAVKDRLIQANCEELVRAILESASEAKDEDILVLINSVDELDYTP
jgi:hypothetical protein